MTNATENPPPPPSTKKLRKDYDAQAFGAALAEAMVKGLHEQGRNNEQKTHDKQAAPGSLEHAITIAVHAHQGQKDKVGSPYILHPLRVMLRCRTEVERIAAVLHDVVEDCPGWSFERLREEGFSEEILAALAYLTKRPEEEADYMSFIRRAAKNSISRAVKLADIEDNLDVTRLPSINENDRVRLSKYIEARMFLLDYQATE